jgi:hypothetical protein
MTRAELLEGASQRLLEAVLLLTVAGEDRLASDIERLAGWIDFVASHPSSQRFLDDARGGEGDMLVQPRAIPLGLLP